MTLTHTTANCSEFVCVVILCVVIYPWVAIISRMFTNQLYSLLICRLSNKRICKATMSVNQPLNMICSTFGELKLWIVKHSMWLLFVKTFNDSLFYMLLMSVLSYRKQYILNVFKWWKILWCSAQLITVPFSQSTGTIHSTEKTHTTYICQNHSMIQSTNSAVW